MILGRRDRKRLRIVIATRLPCALSAIENVAGNAERREALSTLGLYHALPGAHLVIADLDELSESPGFSRERIRQVLASLEAVVVDGATFAAAPAEFLARAGAVAGIPSTLPPVGIAFASLSGGVGKTTLSLSLARYFREHTGLPVAVVELSVGPSALSALLTLNGHGHIYEVVSQGKAWSTWNGVTVAGMDWRFARMLTSEEIADAWRSLAESHVLTIFDAPAYHPLYHVVERLAKSVVVVADPRPDSISNAVFLAGKEGSIIVNRGGLSARLALDRSPVAVIPHVDNASSYPSSIGRRLMPVVYPGWKK